MPGDKRACNRSEEETEGRHELQKPGHSEVIPSCSPNHTVLTHRHTQIETTPVFKLRLEVGRCRYAGLAPCVGRQTGHNDTSRKRKKSGTPVTPDLQETSAMEVFH